MVELSTAATFVNFVYWVFTIYILLIVVYILFSWFQLPYNVWLGRIRGFLYDACEPYLRLFRGIVPPLGGLDFSPAIAIIVLILAQRIVDALLVSLLL
jgi:YggT family protein